MSEWLTVWWREKFYSRVAANFECHEPCSISADAFRNAIFQINYPEEFVCALKVSRSSKLAHIQMAILFNIAIPDCRMQMQSRSWKYIISNPFDPRCLNECYAERFCCCNRRSLIRGMEFHAMCFDEMNMNIRFARIQSCVSCIMLSTYDSRTPYALGPMAMRSNSVVNELLTSWEHARFVWCKSCFMVGSYRAMTSGDLLVVKCSLPTERPLHHIRMFPSEQYCLRSANGQRICEKICWMLKTERPWAKQIEDLNYIDSRQCVGYIPASSIRDGQAEKVIRFVLLAAYSNMKL